MEYCLGTGDGGASMWSEAPDLDLDGDGVLDAVRIDLDGDGLFDDALTDADGDDLADRAAVDGDDDGAPEAFYTDDGSGAWAVSAGGGGPRVPRWFGLDGVEHTDVPADLDGDGTSERLFDVDRDGVADRAVSADGATGFADTDGDGRWDVVLTDADGDGAADAAGPAG